MVQNQNDKQKELLARIESAMEHGGLLTRDVLGYVERALFTPEPALLIEFLTDETDCERDTLLDLIFSPDVTFQESLEPLLESAVFSIEDEGAIEKSLVTSRTLVPIHLPDQKNLVTVAVPEDIKVRYLTRLNITHHLDSRLRRCIEKGVREDRCPSVKVTMRNAGLSPSPRHHLFLCRYFERMEDGASGYFECLDLVLSLLGSATGERDVYDLLAEQKRILFRGLKQIKRFEEILSRSNMETLMMQGVRVPHSSRSELVHRMELIDRICFGVFGKTEIIPEPVEERMEGIEDMISPKSFL